MSSRMIAALALAPALIVGAAAYGQCPGDCTGDGVVDVADLVSLVLQWGTDGACDLNGDGIVNVIDIVTVITSWGPCPEIGACCLAQDLVCLDGLGEGDCAAFDGIFMGIGSGCGGSDCSLEDVVLGACCTANEGCIQTHETDCDDRGGIYQGDGALCEDSDCCPCVWSPAVCELYDCNGNGQLDSCDVLLGVSTDCNENGSPDECDDDCNQNGISDSCELDDNDCNQNGVPDECEPHCAGADMPDDCYLALFPEADCDANGIPDACELADDDCNGNGVPDTCEIAGGLVPDCNGNGIPDGCEALMDCDANGIPDDCQLALDDCNGNSIPDACDIASGASQDADDDGVPDECQIGCEVDLDADSDNDGVLQQDQSEESVETRGAGLLIPVNDDDDEGLEDDLVRLVASAGCDDSGSKLWMVSYPTQSVALYLDPLGLTPVPAGVPTALPVPPEFWVEGLAPSAAIGDVVIALTVLEMAAAPGDGGGGAKTDRVKATVLKPQVESIDFDSGITLYDPANDKERPETEWVRDPARSLEAAYVRTGGSVGPSRDVAIELSINAEFSGTLKVKASASDTLTVGEVPVKFKKGKAKKDTELGDVPDVIKRFKDVVFTWKVDVKNDGTFAYAEQKTTHTIYVTRAKPIKFKKPLANTNLYPALYELSSDWAAGKREEDETLAAIWAKVKALNSTTYGYYCPDVPKKDGVDVGFELRELIKDKNGRCEAWARLFIRMNGAHGIAVKRVGITPSFTMTFVKVAGDMADGFLVKNWTSADAAEQWTKTNPADDDGVPGQRAAGTDGCGAGANPPNKPATKAFADHVVTEYTNHATTPETILYDPSYGTEYTGADVDARLKAWDTAALNFFIRAKEVTVGGARVVVYYFEANPAATKDVTGTPADWP